MKKIGIIGSGTVGKSLAKGFLKYGYSTMIASRSKEKQDQLAAEIGGKIKTGDFVETAKYADIIVLSVKGTFAIEAVKLCSEENLEGKTIIDTTNPIADLPPENGVLHYFTTLKESLMEQLQKAHRGAHFVKAFNSVGNAFMVDPDFEGGKPTMFICGNSSDAKKDVEEILTTFGWETEDMGGVESARAIEPLCILWCIPGFRENRWQHAFKLLKK